jgi:hypothetical protein
MMTDERREELRQIAGGIDGPKSQWLDECLDEIDRLRAIESRLPRYTDTGQPFVPGDDGAWVIIKRGVGYEVVARDVTPCRDAGWKAVWEECDVEHRPGFYSTKAAAEAAMKGGA